MSRLVWCSSPSWLFREHGSVDFNNIRDNPANLYFQDQNLLIRSTSLLSIHPTFTSSSTVGLSRPTSTSLTRTNESFLIIVLLLRDKRGLIRALGIRTSCPIMSLLLTFTTPLLRHVTRPISGCIPSFLAGWVVTVAG